MLGSHLEHSRCGVCIGEERSVRSDMRMEVSGQVFVESGPDGVLGRCTYKR